MNMNTPFYIDVNNPLGIDAFLRLNNYLYQDEFVEHTEKAGEGNMNVVVRVCTNMRSFVLKQSLPWVQRFPAVAAPQQRILTEYNFYKTVQENVAIQKLTPKMYWLNKTHYILCMEDLGQSHDFMHLYKKGRQLQKDEMADIARVISELHLQFKYEPTEEGIANMEMRKLNHHHIFQFPLDKHNGFNLDEVQDGLQAATQKLRSDKELNIQVEALGQVYLATNGTRLLHGDYYPGSWLKTRDGFRMIDPEFCFKGPAEFELAVAVAHLKMAQQPEHLLKDLFVYYHFDSKFDGSLFSKFAGVEMIRRILGLAQLPLELNLNERLALLDEAYELVVNG